MNPDSHNLESTKWSTAQQKLNDVAPDLYACFLIGLSDYLQNYIYLAVVAATFALVWVKPTTHSWRWQCQGDLMSVARNTP